MLNYVVTSNHIHLLVKDTQKGVIAQSMQLIAGRSAQHYNQRKNRNSAYWEDRYHATAIQSDHHLFQCMTYIDLNMVCAGVVKHPHDWPHGGYYEIQNMPKRYAIIDLAALIELGSFNNVELMQQKLRQWVSTALKHEACAHQSFWSKSVAVGSLNYIEAVQSELGIRASGRECIVENKQYILKESAAPYNADFNTKMEPLSE